jgi:hypothetical protein
MTTSARTTALSILLARAAVGRRGGVSGIASVSAASPKNQTMLGVGNHATPLILTLKAQNTEKKSKMYKICTLWKRQYSESCQNVGFYCTFLCHSKAFSFFGILDKFTSFWRKKNYFQSVLQGLKNLQPG